MMTVVIAASTFVVAWRQWLISKDKLRLDLFEKRYKVYQGAQAYIASIARTTQVEFEAQKTFWHDTIDSPFLFGDDVHAYLKLINERAGKLHTTNRQLHRAFLPPGTVELDLEGPPPELTGQQRQQLLDDQLELNVWFEKQLHLEGLPAKFSPYLKFQDHAQSRTASTVWAIAVIVAVAGGAFLLGKRAVTATAEPAQSQEKAVVQAPPPPAALPSREEPSLPARGKSDTAAPPAQRPGAAAPAEPAPTK